MSLVGQEIQPWHGFNLFSQASNSLNDYIYNRVEEVVWHINYNNKDSLEFR